MKNDTRNIKLASLDDLFTTEESRADGLREKVIDIALSDLYPFKNHPFQVNDNEELRDLAKSIMENDMVTPAIARPRKEGGYEMIAGHRRKAACEIAGIETMPVLVREMDDDTAILVMVDSNKQRENLLPSEKAFSYRMRLEAMKRQGWRTDLTLSQFGTKLRTDQQIAEQSGDSRNQIARYIRLTNLIPELLKMVDEKSIAFNPGVEISYLPKKTQNILCEAKQEYDCTPSLFQAIQMKELSNEDRLDSNLIHKLLSKPKANQIEKISFQYDRLKQYFPNNYTIKQIEDGIIRMLDERQKKLQKQREQGKAR